MCCSGALPCSCEKPGGDAQGPKPQYRHHHHNHSPKNCTESSWRELMINMFPSSPSIPTISSGSVTPFSLSLCCRRRMVDLGLVFLCSCGIGAMHRGSMGANSADFPGSLPKMAMAFFFRGGGVVKTSCWVAGVGHGHMSSDCVAWILSQSLKALCMV